MNFLNKFKKTKKIKNVQNISDNSIANLFILDKGYITAGKWNKKIFKNKNEIIVDLIGGKNKFILNSFFLYKQNFISFTTEQVNLVASLNEIKNLFLSGREIYNIKLLIDNYYNFSDYFIDGEVSKFYLAFPNINQKNNFFFNEKVLTELINKLKFSGSIEIILDKKDDFDFVVNQFQNLEKSLNTKLINNTKQIKDFDFNAFIKHKIDEYKLLNETFFYIKINNFLKKQ